MPVETDLDDDRYQATLRREVERMGVVIDVMPFVSFEDGIWQITGGIFRGGALDWTAVANALRAAHLPITSTSACTAGTAIMNIGAETITRRFT